MFRREPILEAQAVGLEGRLVEQVAEGVVEGLVLVVGNLEDAVFDAERVGVVVAQVVAGDLGRPAGEILAVEEADPAIGRWGQGDRTLTYVPTRTCSR